MHSLVKKLIQRCAMRATHIRHASTGNKTSSLDVFNRSLKLRQREMVSSLKDSDYYDYLRQESALRLTDRLDDINRTFPTALELGSYKNILSNILASRPSIKSPKGGIGGVESLIEAKSDIILPNNNWPIPLPTITSSSKSIINTVSVVCDEENLPFPPDSFDLVISNLNMHWVNDLPRALRQILNVLKPDGAFVASMLGGGTLKELKHCFYLADQERKGGLSPHASPMTLASDIAGLIQGANFALPTIDIDTVQISYPDAFSLMEHLYKMGEGHAAHNRHLAVGRDTMLAMAALYQDQFGLEDGSVSATFEIIYLIGWKPHSSQPKACRRGVVRLIIHLRI
jgi:NADH dehydrogenase [ubiquinone] 1 alpha subcomplex assembly factor 5